MAKEDGDELPAYADRLRAMHEAFRPELQELLAQAPAWRDDRVLDVGCGEGFYVALFAAQVHPGEVVALDSNAAYLDAAREHCAGLSNVSFARGTAEVLPFEAGSFDVVWSSHSLQSYADPPAAFREFRRVLRPGGRLLLVESDPRHDFLMPLPLWLEDALREGSRQHLRREEGVSPQGVYFCRQAPALLAEAGMALVQRRVLSLLREGPARGVLRRYLDSRLDEMLTQARALLPADRVSQAEAFLSPGSPDYLPDQPGFFLLMTSILHVARVSAGSETAL